MSAPEALEDSQADAAPDYSCDIFEVKVPLRAACRPDFDGMLVDEYDGGPRLPLTQEEWENICQEIQNRLEKESLNLYDFMGPNASDTVMEAHRFCLKTCLP